jgi:hypothetical protein
MPTKQLLGRLHSLQQCERLAALSDRTPEEIAISEGILFKNTAEWQKAHADLKAVLATQEHVPSAAERAKARQERVKKKSNKSVGGVGGTALLRPSDPPYFGWLCSPIAVYPNTLHLKLSVRPRPPGLTPLFTVEPTEHPLALDQHNGISIERLHEFAHRLLHA